jgi:hypothetical protein
MLPNELQPIYDNVVEFCKEYGYEYSQNARDEAIILEWYERRMRGVGDWCKLKANDIINNPNISCREKYARLHKQTCSGCEIYKEMKK